MISLLGFGFLIGMRHAMEADHAAAVATLATKSHTNVKGLLTVWFPVFTRKYKAFSDSFESIDFMYSIFWETFYHKSITQQPSPLPSYKFIFFIKT